MREFAIFFLPDLCTNVKAIAIEATGEAHTLPYTFAIPFLIANSTRPTLLFTTSFSNRESR